MIASRKAVKRLAHAMVLAHRRGEQERWRPISDLAPALDELTEQLGDGVDRSDIRGILASVGELSAGLRRQVVPLLSASDAPTDSDLNRLPASLVADRSSGPPEEDVFRLSLACGGWHSEAPAEVDVPRLREAAQILGSAASWHSSAMALVLARYGLKSIRQASPHAARGIVRRVAWVLDACGRGVRPEDLMVGLVSESDPWVRLDVPLVERIPLATSIQTLFELGDWHAWCEETPSRIRLGGRLRAVRLHRQTVFADLVAGNDVAQLAISRERIPFSAELRPGDLVVVEGLPARTDTGDRALVPDRFVLHEPNRLEGSLWNPPGDVEAVSSLLGLTRALFARRDFKEVFTPVLKDSFQGGRSRPFVTWEAARSRTRYLRVTTELDLLQLIGQGTRRCYEIGPSFRNEGLHGESEKEYLMLEAYASDLDMQGMLALAEDWVAAAVGRSPASFRRLSFAEAFEQIAGVSPSDPEAVVGLARAHLPEEILAGMDMDSVARWLWKSVVRSRLDGLVAISAIPGPASPLIAGRGCGAYRSWLYVDGIEVAEVAHNERRTDVVRERMLEQFRADACAVQRDYRQFLASLAYGLPPVVGVGAGFTRLARLHRKAVSGIEEAGSPDDG